MRLSAGLFEVKDVSPPPRVLGIHSLPPDTHNGDQIEVEGQVAIAATTHETVQRMGTVRTQLASSTCRIMSWTVSCFTTSWWEANISEITISWQCTQPAVSS